MSILKYFAKKDSGDNFRLPDVTASVSITLSPKDIRSANEAGDIHFKPVWIQYPSHANLSRDQSNSV